MDIFNNLQVINECLLDVKRTRAFEKAINSVIKKNNIVMDCGTGTGIMALFAAKAGARKVYAVDIAQDTIQQAQRNIGASPHKDKITLICSDLKRFKQTETVDVVIMEMLDTGLVSEQQAIALNHLHANQVIGKETQLIPYKADNYLEAIDYDFNFYGFEMPCIIQARNFGANDKVVRVLSQPTLYRSIDFTKHIDRKVDEIIEIDIEQTGYCNAVRMKTRIALTKTQRMWGTPDMNMPVIIPIAPKKVHKGEKIKIHIQYSMGDGFASFITERV